jgi:HPt (histidine-containing phosphotransfer) domain-containing protein
MKTILERLDKWMPAGADAAPPPVADQATPDNGAPVDRSALTGIFGDDAAAIRGVLDDFLDSSQGDLSELTGAMDARDADHLMRTAHRIKGAARIIGANALADASYQLELAGRNKDLSRLDQLRGSFLSSLEAVAAYIRAQ